MRRVRRARPGSDDLPWATRSGCTQTYGFPIELTVELARERGQPVDVDGYRRADGAHSESSRGTGGEGSRQRGRRLRARRGFATEFVGYAKIDVLTQLGALEELGDGTFLAKLRESPFYPAGGGQVTDQGWIERDDDPSARAELVDGVPLRRRPGAPLPRERLRRGDRVRARRAVERPLPDAWRTTPATHLLHARSARCSATTSSRRARRCGPTSSASTSRTRRRYAEERGAIEERVNEQIFENLPVHTFETTARRGAHGSGAMMLFGEKYGDVVRVVDVAGTSRPSSAAAPTSGRRPRSARSRSSPRGRSAAARGGSRRSRRARRGRLLTRACRRGGRPRAELEDDSARSGSGSRGHVAARGRARTRRSCAVDGVNVIVQAVDGLEADALLELSDRFKRVMPRRRSCSGRRGRRKRQPRRNFDDGGRGAGQRLGRDQRCCAARRRRRRRPADDGAGRRQGCRRSWPTRSRRPRVSSRRA